MINLLPKENKQVIKREHLRRLLVVASFFVLFDLIAGAIVLLPFSYSLFSHRKSYENQLELSEKRLSEKGTGQIESFVVKINQQALILQEGQKNNNEISALIKKILEIQPLGITINSLGFSEEQISIKGKSQNRKNLLDFIDFLKKDEELKNVDSPVSNLLKDKDLDFSISVEL